MKHLTFWFDPISPYAYLAFERLPQVLEGVSYSVDYRPVLFAGLLQHFDHKGPAEIAPKRLWTYRDVAWRAHVLGLPLDMPACHPFNPLALLRMAQACAKPGDTPNRRVVEALFHHVWRGGQEAASPERLAQLRGTLAPLRDPDSADVKAELRANAQQALAQGVFGVPSLVLDGTVFWGDDALPMLRAAMLDDPWFHGAEWHGASQSRPGVSRG